MGIIESILMFLWGIMAAVGVAVTLFFLFLYMYIRSCK
jgi:hypothetical protein